MGLTGDAADLTLSAGRLYVDGILCELGQDATYTAQLTGLDPALAAFKPALPAATGSNFVFADVWQRHVTALEDPRIRETALGGPDTATRTQTFWQVKLVAVDAGSHCLSSPRAWQDATAVPTGRLRARTHPGEPPSEPCIVPANAGYTRLENQLYRVEVHQGGALGAGATFKWSRDNGSVVTEWLGLDNADPKKPRLTVRDTGRDKLLGFAAGQWVEVTDDIHEIQGNPGRLARLLDVQGNVLTLDLTTLPALSQADFPVHPKVRRWDSGAEIAIAQPAGNGGWLGLEGGVEVHFEAGTYRSGDYWLIPARAFIGEFSGDIEWPQEGGSPAALPAHGVEHHFCKLAVVDFDAAAKKFSNPRDCRLLFPAVTELVHLFHVGGDGQEALPGQALPCPLEVGVTNGQWPVPGARVEFKASAGSLDVGLVQTDAGGVARCVWTLPAAPQDGRATCMSVTATLRDVAGNPVSIPLVFHASHSQGREPGVVVKAVTALADKKPLDNDSLVNLRRFLDGLLVETDRKLADVFSFPPVIAGTAQLPFPPRPSFQVILHVPYTPGLGGGGPLTDGASFGVGFQPLLLAGAVSAVESGAQWVPSDGCRRWLEGIVFQRLNPNRIPGFRLLVQVILKGRFIWSAEDPDLFLDGEAFGRQARGRQEVGLTLPSGDGRRGGDFEMWFWLAPDPAILNASTDGNLVVGSVLDFAGAPLPGIKITLLVPAAPRSAVTSSTGNFSFPQVPNGRFTGTGRDTGRPHADEGGDRRSGDRSGPRRPGRRRSGRWASRWAGHWARRSGDLAAPWPPRDRGGRAGHRRRAAADRRPRYRPRPRRPADQQRHQHAGRSRGGRAGPVGGDPGSSGGDRADARRERPRRGGELIQRGRGERAVRSPGTAFASDAARIASSPTSGMWWRAPLSKTLSIAQK